MTKILLMILLTVATVKAGIYENLEYGDTRAQVEKKLLASSRVKSTVPTTMIGRAGLNGSFEIKKDLGGLKFDLFFGWSSDGKLTEVTLRSKPVNKPNYDSRISSTFEKALSLISNIHGKPLMSNDLPPQSVIKEGSIINSHLWHAGQGSILLGIAQLEKKYHLSIRFTEKKIEPVSP